MLGTNILSASFIESDLLQTTQDDDAIGGNVATISFGFNLPLLLQTLQEIGVPHVAKG
jgi:hypothetical protein